MTPQRKESDYATNECPGYDNVFLGTLEDQGSSSTSVSASIEQRKKPH